MKKIGSAGKNKIRKLLGGYSMQKPWLMALLIIMAVVLLTLPLVIYAQDDGGGGGDAAGEGGGGGSGLWDLLKAGGTVGWFIVFCSFIGMGLIIEHLVNIKRDKLCPPEIVAELEALVDEGQYEDAIALCSANPNFFCNIIGAALAKVDQGYDSMVAAMEEAGEEQANKLNIHISYLSLLGSMGPMLGLTGTVTGMIAAFGVIKQYASPSPKMLATGVEEALVTTAEGLFVAMPVLTAFFFFKNKCTQLIIEIGMVCGEFVDKFKSMQPAEK